MTHAALVGSRVEIKHLVERHVASVRTTTQGYRLRHTIALLHELVMDAVGQQGLAPAGPLFTRYHEMGSLISLEAGIPLAQPITPMGIVAPSSLPGGPALCMLHVGDHDVLPAVRAALHGYAPSRRFCAVGATWECYLVDGRDTPDPSEWLTEIYVPVRRTTERPTLGTKGTGRMALPQKQSIGK